jgi:citrate lyase beta subunit
MPQLSVGATEPGYGGDHWHYVRWRILATARAFGLQPIDGPVTSLPHLEQTGYPSLAFDS